MNLYEEAFLFFKCTTLQELYSKLEFIARNKLGLDGVTFTFSALEHPSSYSECMEINAFILQCIHSTSIANADVEAIELIKFLKKNPPEEFYGNPKLPDDKVTPDQFRIISHIFIHGIDLPGSKHNPFGHLQHYSSFFIDMFFGNFTEFNDHVKSLSKKVIQKEMKRREGFCQFSPLFAPILGLNIVHIDDRNLFTIKQKQEIRSMYSLYNENKHEKIIKQLIKLGADVNAHDINGFTPLHYAVHFLNENMVQVLLQHKANPNYMSRIGITPFSYLKELNSVAALRMIQILIQNNARLTDREEINDLRNNVELYGSKELAVRVREVHPREKEECEKCGKSALRVCAACGLVYCCTPVCQKLDWRFHKVTCQKNKRNQ